MTTSVFALLLTAALLTALASAHPHPPSNKHPQHPKKHPKNGPRYGSKHRNKEVYPRRISRNNFAAAACCAAGTRCDRYLADKSFSCRPRRWMSQQPPRCRLVACAFCRKNARRERTGVCQAESLVKNCRLKRHKRRGARKGAKKQAKRAPKHQPKKPRRPKHPKHPKKAQRPNADHTRPENDHGTFYGDDAHFDGDEVEFVDDEHHDDDDDDHFDDDHFEDEDYEDDTVFGDDYDDFDFEFEHDDGPRKKEHNKPKHQKPKPYKPAHKPAHNPKPYKPHKPTHKPHQPHKTQKPHKKPAHKPQKSHKPYKPYKPYKPHQKPQPKPAYANPGKCAYYKGSAGVTFIRGAAFHAKAPWKRVGDSIVWKAGGGNKIDAMGSGEACVRFRSDRAGPHYITLVSAAPHRTEHNDAWVSVSSGVNLYRASKDSWRAGGSGYYKVYQNKGHNKKAFYSVTVDHNGHQLISRPLKMGRSYSLCLAGRSSRFRIFGVAIVSCGGGKKCSRHDTAIRKALRNLKPARCVA